MIRQTAVASLLFATVSCAPRMAPREGASLYQDPSAPTEARVSDLLARMTLEEKVAQMEAVSMGRNADSLLSGAQPELYGLPGARLSFGAVTGLGFGADGPGGRAEMANRVQRYFVEETRLGIPVLIVDEALHGVVTRGATNYPTPLALASTFDTALVHEVFREVGREAARIGTSLVLSPVLDVVQDPRWGRAEETYGEDPYLASRMAVAAITGYQGGPAPSGIGPDHVAATTKHFAGHGAPEGGLNIGPVHMSEVELRNIHLRSFEAAVREAGVAAVMPAYHEILGAPVHANPLMLTQILRDEWGFDGVVVSDFFAIRYNFSTHHVAPDSAEAGRLAAVAGVDIDLPELASYRFLVDLVQSGQLDETVVDRSVRRVLRLKFRLGLFDDPYVDPAEAERVVAQAGHLQTARKAATRGMVLLKNDDALLPLDPGGIGTLALIGPHADLAERGNYSGLPSSSVTPLNAVRERLGSDVQVLYAEGARLLEGGRRFGPARLADDTTNQRLLDEAVAVAEQADVVVLALGATARMMHESWAGNEGDNASLELRGTQNALVDAVLATGKPAVVMLFSGGPLSFRHVDGVASTILYGWYLGQETGNAVADILFGDAEPSGRLPVSIARSVGQIPAYYNHAPSARRQGYVFEESSDPLYPFGFGLGYTTFEFDNLALARETISTGDSVEVSIRVANTGSREGTAVVQLYIRKDHTIPIRPAKELKDFARVALAPGESTNVTLHLTPEKLGHYEADGTFVVPSGAYRVMVGSSSRDEDLETVTLEVRQ
jgi:beta-glucosidase